MGFMDLLKKKQKTEDIPKGNVHIYNDKIPDKMKEAVRQATRESIKDGNITDVAFNFTDELDGLQYKYVYTIRKESPEYDSEDVCNKIIDALPVKYGKFESLTEFFNRFPDFKSHLIASGFPDVEKTGIYLDIEDCGNSKLISSQKEYYQFPLPNECPLLVRGVRCTDKQNKEVIHFS